MDATPLENVKGPNAPPVIENPSLASPNSVRLLPVDAVRGLIMLFMAIDHVGILIIGRHSAEYWGGVWTRYGEHDQLQFVFRLLSDLCAPGFFLWMGLGIALLSETRLREGWSMPAIRKFLILRGLLLIAIGQFVETPAWIIALVASDRPLSSERVPGGGGSIYIDISVIFALGASMALAGVLIALCRRRPWIWIVLGTALLFVSNAWIPNAERAGEAFPLWQRLLLITGQTGVVLVEYPVLPWFAIACLGVALGQFLESRKSTAIRMIPWVGLGMIVAACALRLAGDFGNTRLPRDESWIEFFNLIKYPPSLTFSLMMVGGNLLLFALFAEVKALTRKAGQILVVLGRVPLFFYLAHLYLFALIGATFFRQGTDYLVGLSVWAAGMVPLYYASAWFDGFKRTKPATSVWRML